MRIDVASSLAPPGASRYTGSGLEEPRTGLIMSRWHTGKCANVWLFFLSQKKRCIH